MFTKKKSLAKIATLRSKNNVNNDSDESGSSSDKRMSWTSENLLIVPLQKSTSTSTPNLSDLQEQMKEKAKKKIINETSKLPSRNHSLKYSKGSLHDRNCPMSFDHDFTSTSSPVSACSSPPSSPVNSYRAPSPPPPTPPPPVLVVNDEVGRKTVIRVNTASSPIKLAKKSPSLRVRKKKRLLALDKDYEDTSDDDDDDGNKSESVYGTPPKGNSLLTPQRMAAAGVNKSRSMVSLVDSPNHLNNARDRSFLVGSVGANSLLGSNELEKCFPNRNLRLFVGTWNMNGKAPPRRLADFLLPKDLTYVPDILVIGTQESFPERFEWEVRLQDTLGPTHVLFRSTSMGTLHQAIFIRRDLIWHCSLPESDAFNAHPGTQMRTKGAIATAFLLFGTSFLFINSHLTAHQDNTKDRVKDYQRITAMLNLPKDLPTRGPKYKEISDKFDCVFWCGDLNFRLEQTREIVIREVRDGLSVLDFDQLNFLRRESLIFKGFHECDIHFNPTYKYDVGTNKFDTSNKQRTPSYTDRILFKHQPNTEIKALHYDSVQDVFTSDHKPVWGTWEIKLRPGRDNVPLAGGLFNREVYVEGLKRRAEALQPVLGKTNMMCSIQ